MIFISISSMNIQQLEYAIALAETRHFETAAARSFVTQSTLSTMVAKLEEELGIAIFDRKKKPLEVTSDGKALLEHMRVIIKEIHQLRELSSELKGEVKGELKMAVIPTIAPFLLPLFLQDFAARFPNLTIRVREQTTGEIMRQLKTRELDIGIVSTPLEDSELLETKLYDEPFVHYDAGKKQPNTISVERIDLKNILLLEEGHCMRTQVMRLCDIKRKSSTPRLNFEFKAGSIDSLLRFVKANKAATLLPYLATTGMNAHELSRVSRIGSPEPYRTVGLVVHRHFVKRQILTMLHDEITQRVSKVMPQRKRKGEELAPL
ncbi:MAG: LysR substrate-binding domain-containing protein [Flavobacteriales bacterium]